MMYNIPTRMAQPTDADVFVVNEIGYGLSYDCCYPLPQASGQ